jgi:beta-barrel assembly-enhancing protease
VFERQAFFHPRTSSIIFVVPVHPRISAGTVVVVMQAKSSARTLAILLAAMMILQPIGLLAQTSPQLPDPGKVGMNKQQQEQLGLQAMGEVYKQMPVLPDSSPITQYIQQLGAKLTATIPQQNSWPFQFHVIPQKEINAFALPGGPIFVNIRTIQAAASEAELAGVMAHEISHVYMQHSAKQAPKSMWTQLAAGVAGILLPQSGLGNLGRMGIQIGAGTVLAKYSRKDEAQADAVGAIIMYRTGYDPKAMADFFTTLEKKYGNGGPQFLSDHPNPGNRQEAIQREIQNWPKKNYLASSNSFARARENSNSIRTYSAKEISQGAQEQIWAQENRRNGATPPNLAGASAPGTQDVSNVSLRQVRPSDTFIQTQQNGFVISYPENWKTTGSGNSSLIAPPEGASQAGIAYGVIINATPSNGGSLDESTQQVIQSVQRDNPGMRTTGEPATIQVGGIQGRSVYLTGNSPVQQGGQPLAERDWLVTLPHPRGGLIYLVFVAPERDFSQLHPTYRKMLDSLTLR